MVSSFLPRGACAVLVAALSPVLHLHAEDRTPAPARTADSAVTPVDRNPGRHEELMKRKQEGPVDLLFLGDSITDFWPSRGPDTWAKFAPYHPADFGVSGERTEDVLWRLTHGELDGIHPKVVVLMLGTNNVGQHPDEQPAWVVGGLRKVVGVIREKLPDAKLLLLGIFPRGEKDSSDRKRNDAVNVELAKFAGNGGQTRYLDIGHVFLDANGEVLKDAMPDGLHPNARGYALWYEAMQPTLDEMMR